MKTFIAQITDEDFANADAETQADILRSEIVRCRDCKWWCGKLSSIGRECMNPELQWKWKSSVYTRGVTWQVSARYKAGCQKACKVHFEPKEVAAK